MNESDDLTRIQGTTLWLGWGLVQGLSRRTTEALLTERAAAGRFTGFDDFCYRVPVGLKQLVLLVRVGAFRCFGAGKKELLWRSHIRFNPAAMAVGTGRLFETEETNLAFPVLTHHPLENFYDQIELLGFPLTSPFEQLTNAPAGTAGALVSMPEQTGRVVEMLGYLVNTKPTRTKKGEFMFFAYQLDATGVFFDTVHFPKVALTHPLADRSVYHLRGTVAVEYGHPSLMVSFCQKIPYQPDPRLGESQALTAP